MSKLNDSTPRRTVLKYLADRQEDRRAGVKGRWTRRAFIMTLASVLGIAGVAYGAWQVTGSGGKASAQTGTITVNVSATAPSFGGTNTVHPGSVANGSGATQGGDLSVTITQNNGYTLYVDSIQQAGLIPLSGSCPADTGTFPGSVTMGSDAYVGTSTSYTSYTLPTPVAVPSSASPQTINIPNVVSMSASSPNTCQNVSLTIPVTLTLGTS